MAYAAIGAAPITTLALSILKIVPLHIGAPSIVGAAVVSGVGLLILVPADRQPVFRGLLAGLVAVLLYDCTRMPFVIIGDWPDFIPKIGAWMTNRANAHWSLGYLWRYVGNGAGMGLTFAMVSTYTDRWIPRRYAGLLFGVTIWTGLVVTVLIALDGQTTLFALTPTTLAVSLIGHVVYGSVLGRAPHSLALRQDDGNDNNNNGNDHDGLLDPSDRHRV